MLRAITKSVTTSRRHEEEERILTLLCQLRDELQQEQHDIKALRKTQAELLRSFKPNVSMHILVPYLFRTQQSKDTSSMGSSNSSSSSSSSATLSAQDALTVMGLLVGSDKSNYLKPTSRAVKDEVLRLSTGAGEELNIAPKLMQVMVQQLMGDDVEVSVNATEALSAACRKLGPAFATTVLESIRAAWETAWEQVVAGRSSNSSNKSQASTVCVRCASAMVDIAVAEDALMQAATAAATAADAAKAATTVWITMLQFDQDPLIQMSAMDLIEKLATARPVHSSRLQWLFSDEVVKTVLTMAGGYDEPDPFLGGVALRVVAAMCYLLHEATSGQDGSLLGENQDLLTGFHHALHNWDHVGSDVDRLAIVDAISSFASASEDALELVLDDPVTREAWLSLSVAQTKLKAAILVSVARVIDPPPQVDMNGDSIEQKSLSNTVGMKLYVSVGQANDKQDTTGLLLSLARSPIPEVRIGSYALMEAVAKLSTGGQVLFINGDFFTFLITRENEPNKEGREAKYAIIEALLSSPVIGLLADDIVKKLNQYKSQGPHYAKGLSWELATE